MEQEKHTAPGKNSPYKEEQVPVGLFFNKVAILVDGEFFLKRYASLNEIPLSEMNAENVIRDLMSMCFRHAERVKREVYRIFFYDCEPFSKKLYNPISKKTVDYAKSEIFLFRTALHENIRQSRKFALRLGKLSDDSNARWIIRTDLINELLAHKIELNDIKENQIFPNLRQKQVDMKIGIDIATLTLKKQVDTIVLISGDGDFVPAAKLARREGIDFILDSMYQHVQPELHEHIDGLHSTFRKRRKTISQKENQNLK